MSVPVIANRLFDHPIISPEMDDSLGDNINGPSVIRVPRWVKTPLGAYYMYFAHHKGRFIRLAYADAPQGPWKIHKPGVLHVKDSLFEAVDPVVDPDADKPDWARGFTGDYLYAHVASPDVHVDESSQTVFMYYHGLLGDGDQQTRLAVSSDGLSFEAKAPLLGPPYFRTFRLGDHIYALSWGGLLLRSRNWGGPFERGPHLIKPDAFGVLAKTGFEKSRVETSQVTMRHAEVVCIGDVLHIFYSRIGDSPEAILYAKADISGDWTDWKAGPAQMVLEPELDWEGGRLPLTVSKKGAAPGKVRELRDPCVFTDQDGSSYMYYCGSGESGIGISSLDIDFFD